MNSSRVVAVVLAIGAFLSPCQAAVMLIEGFQLPSVPSGSAQGITSGTHTFDNADWEVVNTGGYGVFVDNGQLFPHAGSQVLAFGGGNASGDNRIFRVISGFTSSVVPEISYDYFQNATSVSPGQGIIISVVDPDNGNAVLYTGTHFGNGSVATYSFAAAPVAGNIVVTISQTGNSLNSDSAIDNLRISAIPEPSVALLGVLGLVATVRRRR